MIHSPELLGTPTRMIMDPVHGGIPFFEHEKDVIDHPLMQRLHHIVQNDVLFLVFPGATHTRFQHSIGTMHIAGEMFKNIVRKYFAEKLSKGAIKNPINKVNVEAFQYFHNILRLAALLHDSGHAPFSHEFEKCPGVSVILSDPDTFTSLWAGIKWHDIYKEQPKMLEHEHFSVRSAWEILNDIDIKGKLKIEPIDVISIMEGTSCTPSSDFIKHARSLLSIFVSEQEKLKETDDEVLGQSFRELFRVMISGEVDVDKMDYLLRDSYFSGAHYGVYNLDHLLSMLRIGYDLGEPWFGLAIVDKGIGALEDFINSRFQLYVNVYGHKTVSGFKYLLRRSFGELFAEKNMVDSCRVFLTDIKQFQYFTDTFLWEKFRHHAAIVPSSYTARFLNRKRMKHLYSEQDMGKLKKGQWRRKLEAHAKAEDRLIKCIDFDAPSTFSKIDKKETLRYIARDPLSGKSELDEVKKHTKLFDRFKDVVITHFFEETA